jgi:hypothetical protein
MINKLAISIFKKNNNLNNTLTIGLYNLKLTHLFSDNGKSILFIYVRSIR